jgi:CRISPR/Cas system CMR subunit Cmr4 (Cas7 group RAMP superfamily)
MKIFLTSAYNNKYVPTIKPFLKSFVESKNSTDDFPIEKANWGKEKIKSILLEAGTFNIAEEKEAQILKSDLLILVLPANIESCIEFAIACSNRIPTIIYVPENIVISAYYAFATYVVTNNEELKIVIEEEKKHIQKAKEEEKENK